MRKVRCCRTAHQPPDLDNQMIDTLNTHCMASVVYVAHPKERKKEKTPTQTPSQVERQTVSEEADVSCHSGRLGHVSHALRTKLSLPANDHHDKIRKYPPRKSGCRNSVKNKQESKVKEVSQCDYCKRLKKNSKTAFKTLQINI